jgi:parallel beta-helix repeat protein
MSKRWLAVTKWCLLLVMALVLCLAVGVGPAAGAGGARYVDKNATRNCQSETPCYPNIQAAVNAAQPGDTIYVFPGTYKEGVDLSQMNPEGNISLMTVDASGNPTPGTVTVDNPGDDSEIYTSTPFDGDVTIDGFVLRSLYGGIDLWVGSGGILPADGLGPFLTRDVEIRNVDASHTGGDGITVRAEGSVTIENCTTNDNNGYGIGVEDAWGDVTITGCTANNNRWPSTSVGGTISCVGGGICVMGGEGQITIRNSTANGNDQRGIFVGPRYLEGQEAGLASMTTPDKVIIDKCTANNNGNEGIGVRGVPGDVTITDCTTNGNGEDGVLVSGRLFGSPLGVDLNGGDVTIKNCTSNGNAESGFDPEGIEGRTLSIQACIARDNDAGVDLDDMWDAESVLVNGSIICGNECGVYLSGFEFEALLGNGGGINLEGNWWGCPGGPEAAGCDPICQEDSIPVDFTPWIAKIADSVTVDPVSVGQATEVSFQFSANPSAVYLGQGPGDLRGPAPFTVSTDNGKLDGNGSTVHKFLGAEGTLKVTLVPEHGGTATVTVSGPCGLTDLEGSKAVVDVLEEDFVPEPGTMLLLGSGLMGLAGYASLRLRRR